ncbi:hypothetical protein CMK17_21465 [Candidatus Poribacteria bacterium]|jgi:hypothetical protein|nr:hypothetical protein [Candidatus Poribacteria bacterium]
MKIRYTLIMLVCMFSSTITSADTHSIVGPSIVGTWALEVSSPRGVQHPTLRVTGDKDTYHGVLTGERGKLVIKEIQVEENTFSFPLKVKTRMGKLKLLYSGQIDADLMQGKIKTPRGTMPFTGKRTE